MRIVLIGQQAFGQAVLDELVRRTEQVVAVYCPPDVEGRPTDPLKDAALSLGIRVGQPRTYRDGAVRDELISLGSDLLVMAYVTLFVPPDILSVPRLGAIQYHPSLLPRHRGPSSINWPVTRGETKTGVTVFWPDGGLDEGPILLQREVEIRDDDTVGSLYFDRLFPMGVQALADAVAMVADGTAPRHPQDPTQATYESWCRHDNVRINWGDPRETTWNLIRGADPRPGAWTMRGSQILNVYDAERRPSTDRAPPGQVTRVRAEGVSVATPDGDILIKRVRLEGRLKVSAADVGIAVGERLDGPSQAG
jgi:methionyl-tRNA formyltransferase